MPECPVPAGKQNYLHTLRGFLQDLGHQIEPAVVGVDQWVVEDQRNWHALLQQHVGKGEAGEDRQLLLRPL